MLKLIAQDGTSYPITTPVTTIGREECDILLLQDDQVSRRHARIEQRGAMWTLYDLDSSNGTFVNGTRLRAPHVLQPGDVIRVGLTNLTVQAEGAAPPTRMIGDSPASLYDPLPSPASASSPAGHEPVRAYAPPQASPRKDRSVALILEILPGLISILGIGWIYAGQTTTGVIILIVDLVCNLIFLLLGGLTVGISLCITVPLQLIAIAVSATLLYQYTQKRPDLFHP